MRIIGSLLLIFLLGITAKTCVSIDNARRTALIEDTERMLDAMRPDMVPPISAKPIDDAAIKRAQAAGDTPNKFCRALGLALRTDDDPEYKRAMIARASDEFASHTKFGQQHSIKKHLIEIGMTPCMAIAAWGPPDRINESVGSYGVHEQWVYPANYLYFENGVLRSFQSQR